jgi:hypothetical protein
MTEQTKQPNELEVQAKEEVEQIYFSVQEVDSLAGFYVKASDYNKAKRQLDALFPFIGQLLDAWEGMPNDLKSDIEIESPSLVGAINGLFEAVGE